MQPPDITVEGASSFELDYWKNMAQKRNPFGKKNSDLSVMLDVKRLREVIGRPEVDHSTMLKDIIESNSKIFASHKATKIADYSTLRERSISALLKHSRDGSTRQGQVEIWGGFSPNSSIPMSLKNESIETVTAH